MRLGLARWNFKHYRVPGGAISLTIVVGLVMSTLVAALAVAAGTRSASARNGSKADQVFYAADSGAQRVTWYCKNRRMSSISQPDGSGTLEGSINGCAYCVRWTVITGDTIALSSTGSSGTTTFVLSERVTPPALPVDGTDSRANGASAAAKGTALCPAPIAAGPGSTTITVTDLDGPHP